MSDRAKEVAIVAVGLFGVSGTIWGAYQILPGFGVLLAGGWVVFSAVMAALNHDNDLKRRREDRR